jgi:hypothetical protein
MFPEILGSFVARGAVIFKAAHEPRPISIATKPANGGARAGNAGQERGSNGSSDAKKVGR